MSGPEFVDVLLDSVIDSAKMLPFLFVAYLAIEAIERSKSGQIERWLARGGRYGFVPGALLGVIPQCGFSAMASNFYSSRVISLGTLLAVYIATSDEAIPILLTQPSRYGDMLLIIGIKVGYALLVGFVLDVLLAKALPASLRGGYGGGSHVDCHDHDEKDNMFVAAAKHTANIFITVFLFTLAFGLLVEWLGEARISGAMGSMGLLQPVVAALFGMIPNCASSVLLTQLYLNDTITLASVLAGLSANAGIGLTVLFRANRNIRQNLFIAGLLLALGILLGLGAQLVTG